jgi:hypothetical protein
MFLFPQLFHFFFFIVWGIFSLNIVSFGFGFIVTTYTPKCRMMEWDKNFQNSLFFPIFCFLCCFLHCLCLVLGTRFKCGGCIDGWVSLCSSGVSCRDTGHALTALPLSWGCSLQEAGTLLSGHWVGHRDQESRWCLSPPVLVWPWHWCIFRTNTIKLYRPLLSPKVPLRPSPDLQRAWLLHMTGVASIQPVCLVNHRCRQEVTSHPGHWPTFFYCF